GGVAYETRPADQLLPPGFAPALFQAPASALRWSSAGISPLQLRAVSDRAGAAGGPVARVPAANRRHGRVALLRAAAVPECQSHLGLVLPGPARPGVRSRRLRLFPSRQDRARRARLPARRLQQGIGAPAAAPAPPVADPWNRRRDLRAAGEAALGARAPVAPVRGDRGAVVRAGRPGAGGAAARSRRRPDTGPRGRPAADPSPPVDLRMDVARRLRAGGR